MSLLDSAVLVYVGCCIKKDVSVQYRCSKLSKAIFTQSTIFRNKAFL